MKILLLFIAFSVFSLKTIAQVTGYKEFSIYEELTKIKALNKYKIDSLGKDLNGKSVFTVNLEDTLTIFNIPVQYIYIKTDKHSAINLVRVDTKVKAVEEFTAWEKQLPKYFTTLYGRAESSVKPEGTSYLWTLPDKKVFFVCYTRVSPDNKNNLSYTFYWLPNVQ